MYHGCKSSYFRELTKGRTKKIFEFEKPRNETKRYKKKRET